MAPATAETLSVLDPPVEIRLRRLASARRITLRISASDGSVHLTMPRALPLSEARMFVMRQEDWLRRRLEQAPGPVRVGIGTCLPVEGALREIVAGSGRSLRLGPGRLEVPGPAETAGRRIAGWLKALARERLVPLATRHAATLGRSPGKVTLRDTGSRWGSCTCRGDLMFSWRLILAPPEILDYVAAHEAAHLVEMNHSDRFWARVAEVCPDHARHRAWLRAEGSGLHRYRFE